MGSWVSWSDSHGWVVILVEFIGPAQPDVILARIRLAVEHPAVFSISLCLNEACRFSYNYAIRDTNKPALIACLYLKSSAHCCILCIHILVFFCHSSLHFLPA